MRFMRHTDAIIIDLRANPGGLALQARKFCAYFSKQPGEYFITKESYIRTANADNDTTFRTKISIDKKLPRYKISNKQLFILTSQSTFSAAEIVTYKIKQYRPETIVIGEKTTGGGNGHNGIITNPYFFGIIPTNRSLDETMEDYTLEGKGITPDIQLQADSAFAKSYRLAINALHADTSGNTRYLKKLPVYAMPSPMILAKYPEYTGNYNKTIISCSNGRLHMTYDSNLNSLLHPEAVDFFLDENFEFVRFIRNATGAVTAIQLKHKDGYLEVFRKTL